MIRHLVIPIAVAALIGTASPASADDSSVVRTPDGALLGTVAAGHRTFQGIPYAAPPVGELRWRAPRPPAPWAGVRDATKPGEPCPQLGQSGVVGSEDCLSLNVDTPRRAGQRLPVLVFVHGGGFVSGQGAGYDPSRITVAGRVVVVTVNYRLGALGFLDHPALRDPYTGNFGLADQQAALRWVRRNIAAFGGDPGNVTLWGQSAGAFSTCAQLAAPGARGLFHKAIVQSGPCGGQLLTRRVAQARGRQAAVELGCETVECLRAKPIQQLAALYEDRAHLLHRRINGRPWLPVTGTPALPWQPLDALRLGVAARVPLIQGGTREEMRAFVGGRYDYEGHPVTSVQYPEILRSMFGPQAGAILAEYPLTSYPTPSLALATLLTDYGGALGACTQVLANDAAVRLAPVFAFEFAEPIDFVLPGFPFGASHGADVPYVFDGPWPSPLTTPARKALAAKLIGYWTNFAHTGRPGPDWPAYRDGTALSLSAGQVGPVDLEREHRCGFWRTRQ